jgi:hypothetical protein
MSGVHPAVRRMFFMRAPIIHLVNSLISSRGNSVLTTLFAELVMFRESTRISRLRFSSGDCQTAS